jgi:rSAM/selenodomain-associated transferase 1
MSANIPLVLFAKAPIAGQVKTRLTTHCSYEQAADIAKLLMQAAIEKAILAWPGKVLLSAAIDIEHPFFIEMISRYSITMITQCEGHLGVKMRHALASCGYPAAVMGCDAPHISPACLQSTYSKLTNGQSVIGPADDGGYYILGLAKAVDVLFEDKAWGTSSVLSSTLNAAASAGLELDSLKPLNDIDEWQDLLDAASQVSGLQQYLLNNNLIENAGDTQSII